jgi:hypothetical protein
LVVLDRNLLIGFNFNIQKYCKENNSSEIIELINSGISEDYYIICRLVILSIINSKPSEDCKSLIFRDKDIEELVNHYLYFVEVYEISDEESLKKMIFANLKYAINQDESLMEHYVISKNPLRSIMVYKFHLEFWETIIDFINKEKEKRLSEK